MLYTRPPTIVPHHELIKFPLQTPHDNCTSFSAHAASDGGQIVLYTKLRVVPSYVGEFVWPKNGFVLFFRSNELRTVGNQSTSHPLPKVLAKQRSSQNATPRGIKVIARMAHTVTPDNSDIRCTTMYCVLRYVYMIQININNTYTHVRTRGIKPRTHTRTLLACGRWLQVVHRHRQHDKIQKYSIRIFWCCFYKVLLWQRIWWPLYCNTHTTEHAIARTVLFMFYFHCYYWLCYGNFDIHAAFKCNITKRSGRVCQMTLEAVHRCPND